ncbi:MAG: phosphatidate cytidylyltransferase [Clostridiaceae bacterium]|jgi:phosphatidate cytidylyltransferase|nr:phosphatidate cytidylyltransferase [Clostridiaceae bacterium]
MKAIKGLNSNATRMLTGLILGTIALLCIKNGGLALIGLLLIIIFFASVEYVKILEHKGFYPSLKLMLLSEVILAAIAYKQRFDLVAVALTFCTMASFMWVLFKGRQPYIANAATTILGFVYCGWFPLHLLFLRDLSSVKYASGLGFVIMMFFAILLTDTGCYYAGRHLGKHKLAPVVSPNKTIEGSIGGAVASIISCVLIGYFLDVSVIASIFIGLFCTIFAQIGDLCESLIKRDAGVKDSGDTLPGHGGFLDRTDSYVFTIPVMFYFCKFFIFTDLYINHILNFFKGLF